MSLRRARWIRPLVLASFFSALSACESGCKKEGPSAQRVDPVFPQMSTQLLADGGVVSALEAAPTVVSVLTHPALAKVRELAFAKDWKSAGEAIELIAQNPPRDLDACSLLYLEGRYFAKAADARSTDTFDRVPAACLFYPDAMLRAAQVFAETGRFEPALDHLTRANLPPAYSTEIAQLRAQALFGANRSEEAKLVLRDLAKDGKLTTPELQFELASTLLEPCADPCTADAERADDEAKRLLINAPKFAEKRNVSSLRTRAHEKLGTPVPPLTDNERISLVQNLLSADAPKGRLAAEELARELSSKKASPDLVCKLATVRANGEPKKKSYDAWNEAIRACDKSSDLPGALYHGAKAAGSAKNGARALELYERLEKEFPKHRLADDARYLRGLRVVDQERDEGLRLLASVADDFPEGDMRADASFQAALLHMTAGDWKAATPLLEKTRAVATTDAAKRRADYFLARAAQENGERDGARDAFEELVRQAPLDFYMALAFARLSALDKDRAAKLLREVIRDETVTPLHLSLPVDWQRSIERPMRLLAVSDFEHARTELRELVKDDASSDALFIVSALYISAGAYDLGHQLVRSKAKEHLAHYPANGRYRFIYGLSYPEAFGDIVARESEHAGIPKAITWGIMREESTFVVDAKSPADAFGLMQMIVPTACGVAVGTPYPCPPGTKQNPEAMETTLRRADVSITLGAKLLGGLRQRFSKNPALAIPSYNAGAGAVERWLKERGHLPFDLFVETIPYDETRNYTKHVLASELAFGELYDPARPNEVLNLPLATEP